MDTDIAFTLLSNQLELLSDALMESGKDPKELLRLLADDLQIRLCDVQNLDLAFVRPVLS